MVYDGLAINSMVDLSMARSPQDIWPSGHSMVTFRLSPQPRAVVSFPWRVMLKTPRNIWPVMPRAASSHRACHEMMRFCLGPTPDCHVQNILILNEMSYGYQKMKNHLLIPTPK